MEHTERCTLCGAPTEFEAGAIKAAWYLCAACEDTHAADHLKGLTEQEAK